MARTRSFLDERREALAASPEPINGIAGIDVNVADATHLTVRFVKPLPGEPNGVPAVPLATGDITITGGDPVRGIAVTAVATAGNELQLQIDREGDFSPYTLTIDENVPGYDPILREITFSFRIHCDADIDCEEPDIPEDEFRFEPRLDYQSRDYDSYRRMMLDRLAVTAPDMDERNVASLEITLVEWLAYVGDQLSYKLDLVDTEYSLETARLRTSASRHARLVGYRMHNGVSARVLAQVEVDPAVANLALPVDAMAFVTRSTELPAPVVSPADLPGPVLHGAIVFEPQHDMQLHAANNRIGLHHWGDPDAILARGAVEAYLRDPDQAIDLQTGDLLILVEERDPATGRPGDADPTHRQAVRLIVDPEVLVDSLEEVAPGVPLQVLRVQWGPEDALRFDLCVGERPPDEDLAAVYGNIVVADHGFTLSDPENLGTVPATIDPELPPAPGQPDEIKPLAELDRPQAFSPQLLRKDLTFSAGPFDPADSLPASRISELDSGAALADMHLSVTGEAPWQALRDLLGAGSEDRVFVPEVDKNGTTRLRFGQGYQGASSMHGKTPVADQAFLVHYRIGTGTSGNIGADALAHIAATGLAAANVVRVRNPLAAAGGADRETIAEVRQRAPVSFYQQRRAVTLADYEALLNAHPNVQRAHARKRWLGSWSAIFLSVDRIGGIDVDDAFREMLLAYLEPFRMMGHDLTIDEPIYVPLAITLKVCVNASFFADDVADALKDVFSAGITLDGQRGFFHSDNISFGAEIYLSRVYQAALAIDGVDDVTVIIFQRASATTSNAIDDGVLRFGPREIPILTNNPNRPNAGTLNIDVEGGR